MYVLCILFVVFISTNNAQYNFFNNIYIIITPTCFDTSVSSSGSSKVVLHYISYTHHPHTQATST